MTDPTDIDLEEVQNRARWDNIPRLVAAVEMAESELRVLKASSSSTIRLQRVHIADLKLALARMRAEWAGVESAHCKDQLAVKKWESRTGLNMSDVLEGVYGKPWGIHSHGSLS